MAELSNIEIPYPEYDAKNLFVRDDKKRNYYLITVKGDKRVDLKEFRQNNNTRALSFASADDLMDIMGLIPGAVTPLGLLNDSECKVTLFLDNDFMDDSDLIGVHPNDNTATVWLKAKDLVKLIQKHRKYGKYRSDISHRQIHICTRAWARHAKGKTIGNTGFSSF